MKIRALVASLVLTAALAVTNQPVAQAADWGGNGSPTACTDAYTVNQSPIYGVRGPTAGVLLGWAQLRWSNMCNANWSRVVLIGTGAYRNTVTVEQQINSEGRAAGATDWVKPYPNGAITWTPYLRLANRNSVACARAWLSSDFGTLNFHTVGGQICG
jgi:hypothetical protein